MSSFPESLTDRYRRFRHRHFVMNADHYEELATYGQSPLAPGQSTAAAGAAGSASALSPARVAAAARSRRPMRWRGAIDLFNTPRDDSRGAAACCTFPCGDA